MKTCPFCKEDIRDEAIKCRYCSSSLLPPQEKTADTSVPNIGSNQVVYILDQDLIRFGKFVAAILAVFTVIGIYLYGIDIKESTKEVETSAKEVEKSADNVNKIKADVDKAQEQINAERLAMNQVTTETQSSLLAFEKTVQSETNAAEAKAQATAEKITEEEKAVAKDKAQTAQLLQEATTTVEEVRQKRNDFFAQVAIYVPGVTEPKNPSDSGASPASSVARAPANDTASHNTVDRAFTPPELAKIYHFPSGTDGTGQTIGIIELGGGFRQADLADYFKNLGIPSPRITSVFVSGAKNSPSTSNSADGEVQLNIEVIGGAAPGAHIVVYFAPNTAQGFLNGIQVALDDKVNHPSVLCITWGSAEASWAPTMVQQMNEVLKTAAARSITVLVASGDNGPTDGITDGKNHVDFPASSPWVTAVGGTHLHASTSEVLSEAVWNDKTGGASGGGVSVVFPMPPWQSNASVPANNGRGTPDVAADASPSSGYIISVDRQNMVIGGTGGAAPLWAALIARINQGLGHNVGFMNAILYEKIGPSGIFHQVASQDGGARGGPEWTTATGWGTPDGQKLLDAFKKYQ